MRAALHTLFLVVVVVLVSAPAHGGQRKRGAPPAQDEARELYKKGMTHYELGAFDEAIGEFKRAYELTSAPGLLFNIAQVYRMKKDAEQALYFYRTYLRLMPDAPNRADVEALISENQAMLDAAKEKDRPRVEPNGTAAAPSPSSSAASTPSAAAPPPATVKRPWRAELWSGVGLAAVGVAALGAGIGLGVKSSSDANAISSANAQGDVPWDAQKQQLYRDGQNLALASTVTYVIGGALAATGAVLVVVGLHDRGRVRAMAIAPTPHGLTLGLTCAY